LKSEVEVGACVSAFSGGSDPIVSLAGKKSPSTSTQFGRRPQAALRMYCATADLPIGQNDFQSAIVQRPSHHEFR
jgi:hypothetical protein